MRIHRLLIACAALSPVALCAADAVAVPAGPAVTRDANGTLVAVAGYTDVREVDGVIYGMPVAKAELPAVPATPATSAPADLAGEWTVFIVWKHSGALSEWEGTLSLKAGADGKGFTGTLDQQAVGIEWKLRQTVSAGMDGDKLVIASSAVEQITNPNKLPYSRDAFTATWNADHQAFEAGVAGSETAGQGTFVLCRAGFAAANRTRVLSVH